MILLTLRLMASSYPRLAERKEIYSAHAVAILPWVSKGPCLAPEVLALAAEWVLVDSLVAGSTGRAGSLLADRMCLGPSHKCVAPVAERESARYEGLALAESAASVAWDARLVVEVEAAADGSAPVRSRGRGTGRNADW